MTKKATGAGLIIEFLLAVFLFIIIAVIFMSFIHADIQLDATAHIISVDAPLTCEMTLTNIMRTETLSGIAYTDLIMKTYLKNSYLDAENRNFDEFEKEINNLFNKIYSKDTEYNNNWTISITLPDGTLFLEHGEISDKVLKDKGVFTCNFYIPYSASRLEKDCKYHYPTEGEKTEDDIELLDKNGAKLNVVIKNELAKEGKEEKFGISSLKDDGGNPIEIKEPIESPYDEGFFSSSAGPIISLKQQDLTGIFTTDFYDSADYITGVFEYNGVHYELKVAEKSPDNLDSSGLVRVLLRQRQQIEDCSLNVTLTLPGTKIYESYEEYMHAQKKLEKED